MNQSSGGALGVYISIPFCRSKCTYCNFASGVYPASEHARYVERVIEDLRHAAEQAESRGAHLPHRVDSIYLGGGTPSLLAPELVTSLFGAIRQSLDVETDAEVTVECAPAQLSDQTLAAMVASGVNRASLGAQSFVDAEVRSSGRLHVPEDVARDLARLRAAGIDNLNVDLIAGLAGQTRASWSESLAALVDTGTPHASVYMLEVDEDSRLGRELLAGGSRYRAGLVPRDEVIAEGLSILKPDELKILCDMAERVLRDRLENLEHSYRICRLCCYEGCTNCPIDAELHERGVERGKSGDG